MANTVSLGGKTLRVLQPGERGSFVRDLDLARLGAEMAAASEAKQNVASYMALAGMVHAYVRCNKGVTLEWVIEELPADIGPVLRACSKASGREVVSKGEASALEMRT